MKLLRNTNFLMFLSGRSTINLADSFYFLIILWTVQNNTSSTFYTSLVYAAMTVAGVFAIFAGHHIDLRGPKKILISSIIIQIICLFIMIYLGQVYVSIVFILSVASTVFYSSERTLFTQLINKNAYKQGNSIITSTDQIINITGYLLGGLSLTIIGFKYSLTINIIIFLIGLLIFLGLMKNKNISQKSKEKKTYNEKYNVLFGTKHILKENLLKIIFILSIISSSVMSLIIVILPKIAMTYGDSLIYSLMYVTFFIGFLIGAILTSFIKINSTKIIFLWIFCGLTLYFFSLASDYKIILLCILLFGMFSGVLNIFLNTIVQMITPKEIMGQTLSTFSTFNNIISSIFVVLGGYLVELYNEDIILVILAIILMFCGFSLLFSPSFLNNKDVEKYSE